MSTVLTASQITAATGLSVKALRLYERHGLINPGRNAAGWRSYNEETIEQLHKIQLLKQMGLRLAEMREVLADGAPTEQLLSAQETVLASQQQRLSNTLMAVRHALHQLRGGKELSIDDLVELLKETMNMNEQSWSAAEQELAAKHYSPSQIERIVEHKQSADFIDEIADVWDSLIQDIEAAQGLSPDSATAKDIAKRWLSASLEFHDGDESLMAATENWYRDGYSDPVTADFMPFPRHIWEFADAAVQHLRRVRE
ncbi:MAG: MerR family transcriptional regulator [Pseudomonadota bacterium]